MLTFRRILKQLHEANNFFLTDYEDFVVFAHNPRLDCPVQIMGSMDYNDSWTDREGLRLDH